MAATATAKPTRERILEAALALFAECGYEGVSTAQIEAAAGLSPRSGALYKHFASKRELLEAAIERHIEEIDSWRERLDMRALADARSELTLVARWGLAELERERPLVAILMREGGRLPGVTERFREAVVRRGHGLAVALVERYRDAHGIRVADVEATAEVMCAALVGYSLQGLLLGPGFVDVDDERFAAAWVEAAMAVLCEERSDR